MANMDMDVAWCLTCAKRTHHPRSPYCSEECRLADIHSSPAAGSTLGLTSPVPQSFIPSPAKTSSTRSKERGSTKPRPALAPIVPTSLSSSSKARDRRAFSFPALPASPPVPLRRRDARQSVALPAFSRRPAGHAVTTPNTPPVPAEQISSSLAVPTARLSKSTGNNTPAIDSVFCSTSESSDNEGLKPKLKQRPMGSSTARPQRVVRPSLPAEFSSMAVDSLRPLAVTRPSTGSRKHSQSPVAAMIASSASSRSREDIISWAKAIKSRPGPGDTDTSDDEERGRSRTRRQVLDAITPPSQEPIDELDEANLGTTPKGRIGSALAGLSIGGFGVGPIVKALTSVTGSSAQPPPSTAPQAPGLQSDPAPAEISRVAVVASTIPASTPIEAESHLFYGGATPTLSTISFSEVVDPATLSTTDNAENEHVDIITDDQSIGAISSSYRRLSKQPSLSKPVKQAPIPQQATVRQTPLPLRPIATTATVIWNLSNYLRSFSPFAIPGTHTTATDAKAALTSAQKTITPSDSSTPVVSPQHTPLHEGPPHMRHRSNTNQIKLERAPITAPMPASRAESPSESPLQLVRSLPMDIIIPAGGMEANEERMREKEARDILERRSRSRRARSRSRSRSRSASRHKRFELSASRSVDRSLLAVNNEGEESRGRSRGRGRKADHGRKWSYDADASDSDHDLDHEHEQERDHDHDHDHHYQHDYGHPASREREQLAESEAERPRGRSRVGKVLGGDDDRLDIGIQSKVAERDWSPTRRESRSRARDAQRSDDWRRSRSRHSPPSRGGLEVEERGRGRGRE